jgi:hypothetical protein
MRPTAWIAVSLVLASVTAFGQEKKKDEPKPPTTSTSYEVPLTTSRGRTAIAVPTRTDNGEWNGTWIYVNRDYNFALWLSEDKGKPIAKIRFMGNGNLVEAFETDWQGHADYSVQGYPARFDLRLEQTGPDFMVGAWDWDLDFQGSARRETGRVEMFRAGDGRQLVMHFNDFERVIESTSGDRTFRLPQSWTFRKLSRRLVLWEELPF